MNLLKKTLCLAVASLCLASASLVSAQSSPPQTPAAGAAPAMDHGKMMEKMHQGMQARMEKHKAQIHDKLKISAEQEGAWKAFTDAMMPQMAQHAMPEHQAHAAMKDLSAPAMMDKQVEHAQAHLSMMQKHADAVKTFYAVLSPEQQKTFDEIHKHMHHRMKMMGRMGHMGAQHHDM
jgi:Spy/CpxP family protein refolding chaperone